MANIKFLNSTKFLACWFPGATTELVENHQSLCTLGPPRDSIDVAVADADRAANQRMSAVRDVGRVVILEIAAAHEVEFPRLKAVVRR